MSEYVLDTSAPPPPRNFAGASSAGEQTPVGVGPAEAYCDAVRTVYEKLANLKPNLRLAAITAVTELLSELT